MFIAGGRWVNVRRLREFNVALLRKWCWRMLVDKDGLWYRVLKARYGEEGGRLKDGGGDSSVWWRMLCGIRTDGGFGEGSWFENNVRRVVGGGSSTFFGSDNWVGGSPLCEQFPRLFDLAVNKGVTVREMARRGWEIGGGAWEWRRCLLVWEEESVMDCSSLLCNVVLQESSLDKWRWNLDPINGYTVKGTYRYLTMPATSLETGLFDAAWLNYVPLKVSMFVWRLLRNRLPTKDNLLRRRVLHHATLLVDCGTLFFSGSVFLSHLQSLSVNIFISLDTWRDYHGVLILFSKLSGTLVVGSFGRREIIEVLLTHQRTWRSYWLALSLCHFLG